MLGGGVVACELAQFLSRIGSEVTLQRSPQLLKEFSVEASECLQSAMRTKELIFNLVLILLAFQIDELHSEISYWHQDEEKTIKTSFLFLALGREPSIENLNLSVAGIEQLTSGLY